MTERDKLKLLLDIPHGDTVKDALLDLLLEQARGYALAYCRMDYVHEMMAPVIIQMAAEDFGRCGGEGLAYRTVSGASESYRGEYSPRIMMQLQRFRRMGAVGC